ncbi:hypothetical protein CWI84_11055 [Idiomarina tyrosinivorans]|uniref:Uncharacterized protein n=1 Tax=Idiomarina tyrosinivorans TaxID=1445662 RepID=A0A432ZFZ6_9GAMM|nr:hypothetical protein [Idiomarina tyrosinivorans]RUO76888.1 hypothetical protein CWI84_11055 [Idiomarina tyrosinivorans]
MKTLFTSGVAATLLVASFGASAQQADESLSAQFQQELSLASAELMETTKAAVTQTLEEWADDLIGSDDAQAQLAVKPESATAEKPQS